MNNEEIEKLFYSNPEKLFKSFQDKGGNFEHFKKLQLGKLLVKERFPELINQDYVEAVEFVFWFTYFMEKDIRDSILFVETKQGKNKQEVDVLVDEMTFGQKIRFIEDHYIDKDKNNSYVKVLKEIKDLRNIMAHGELEKLNYGGYYLSDPRGQLKLLIQLTNASAGRDLIK